MHAAINIDPKNGHVLFDLLEITPKTTTLDLGTDFSIDEEILVYVVGKKVPCKFAKAGLNNEGIKFELSLRFEHEILVSIFVGLSDPSISTQTQEDFYNSLKSVKSLHERWLIKQIGNVSTNNTRFKWGVVGVAQDKSDNIYIYLHNRNNTWAFNP
jgi:hypothetical protein